MIIITYTFNPLSHIQGEPLTVRFKNAEEANHWISKCRDITITSITEEN